MCAVVSIAAQSSVVSVCDEVRSRYPAVSITVRNAAEARRLSPIHARTATP